MSTPPCYGPEMTVNANNCLVVNNPKSLAWPYTGTTSAGTYTPPGQPSASGLYVDSAQGLWVAPRRPLAWSQHDRLSGSAVTLGAAQTWKVFGSSTAVPVPTISNCIPYQVMLNVAFSIQLTIQPADVGLYYACWVGLVDPGGANYTGLQYEGSSEVAGFGATETTCMNGYATELLIFPKAASSLTVKAQMSVYWYSKRNLTATPAPHVVDWSVDYAGMMWPSGTPFSSTT